MGEKDFTTSFGKANRSLEKPDKLLETAQSDMERKRIERSVEKSDATHRRDMAELTKEEVAAKASAEKTTAEPASTMPAGFQLTGGMHIDLDEQRKSAQEEVERLRKEAKEDRERTAEQNNKLRDDLHKADMELIKTSNAAALEALANKIDGRSPSQILKDIRESAAELGLRAPDPSITDPSLALQTLQIQNSENQRQREFEWKMQQDRWDREDKKEERADTRAYNVGKLSVEKEKNEMFAKAPAVLGQFIGQAIADSGKGAAPATKSSADSKISRRPILAPPGEGGDTECGECHAVMAVGPTATMAECAKCGTRYHIQRTEPAEASQAAEE